MLDLGTKHRRYGVKPDMFPIMGNALMYMLKHVLGERLTEVKQEAWKETYAELSGDMMIVAAQQQQQQHGKGYWLLKTNGSCCLF